MRRCGVVLLVSCAVPAAMFASTGTAMAAPHRDCGNPTDRSGRLKAVGVSCQKARAVFKGIHCSDSACTEIHSGTWHCYRRTVSRYKGRGNCSLGSRRIRWVVYE